ncbi:lipoprotein insertase outer membrane protein LolB [Psychromonas sp. psych-6C06]|uniref:lipoprotein insertase outer membrane protein LolB n=1 Tax=Psychromonas sp. psych-6C06 TaxID=2058089 RepID=UPI00187C3944|nr:lipoprotein insertase outer membrane protein LolB [Psychromonas sp. psych-6C06]
MKCRICYLLIPLLLVGCAQTPHTGIETHDSWINQQTRLENLSYWSLSGKLAVITPTERNSVNIHWQQSDEDFQIHLTTFLGLNILEIKKVGLRTVITDQDGNNYVSDDTQQLVQQLSGMDIPIKQLQQWIKGNPKQANYQLGDNQLVSSLLSNQNDKQGWSINYSDYRTVKGINLPYKLDLTRGQLRLKFAIANWQLPTTP